MAGQLALRERRPHGHLRRLPSQLPAGGRHRAHPAPVANPVRQLVHFPPSLVHLLPQPAELRGQRVYPCLRRRPVALPLAGLSVKLALLSEQRRQGSGLVPRPRAIRVQPRRRLAKRLGHLRRPLARQLQPVPPVQLSPAELHLEQRRASVAFELPGGRVDAALQQRQQPHRIHNSLTRLRLLYSLVTALPVTARAAGAAHHLRLLLIALLLDHPIRLHLPVRRLDPPKAPRRQRRVRQHIQHPAHILAVR
eukprot:scaffold10868_cov121-Isochrysis_galbana.AAC.9